MSLSNVHLTPQLVQAVRDAVDIAAIASDYTRLRKAGRSFGGLCPLHKEKSPSFSVDPDKGVFYCFGCGRGGDAIKLHMLLTGDDFPQAIEALAQRHGIPLPTVAARRSGGVDPGQGIAAALEAAQEYFTDRLRRLPEARLYLERRRIDPQLAERFGLGYAPPGWRNLLTALRARVPLKALEAAGLVARSERRESEPFDRFRNRLMFPIRSPSGRLVGFGGRTLEDDQAKYLNTAETESFHKGHLLFGLDVARRAVREHGSVLLVEGYFDVLGAVAAGIEWTVASMGTALTVEQSRLLARYTDEVVVGYDGDAAGQKAFSRCLPLLLEQGLNVRRPIFADGHDPDSLRLAEGDEAVRAAVEAAQDGVLVELESALEPGSHRDPAGQARSAAAAARILKPIADGGLRYGYARQAAARIGLPVTLVLERLALERRSAARPAAGPVAAEEATPRAGSAAGEERILQLLLDGSPELPAPEELPAEDAFFDPVCRNIYRTFRDLYRGNGGRRPEVRLLLAHLADGGEAVDRVARLLLEGRAAARADELLETLEPLKHRWLEQRQRALAAEIDEAQRAGDQDRLDGLWAEKKQVNEALYGARSRPRANGA